MGNAIDPYAKLRAVFNIYSHSSENVAPHQFPLTQQKRMWEPKFDWSFSHEQGQYNGTHAILSLNKTRKTI